MQGKRLPRAIAVVLVILGISGTIFIQTHTFNPITVSGDGSSTQKSSAAQTENLEQILAEKTKQSLQGKEVSGLLIKEDVIFCLSEKNVCGLYNPKTERITVTSGNIKGLTALKRISRIYERQQ